ncbi:MAG: hypothetical protein QOF01_518 [Thermomicrobiales bacterium]|jgi:hypothetical protein|nr:hypothetical protein [Thermomicrobiales bacterium]
MFGEPYGSHSNRSWIDEALACRDMLRPAKPPPSAKERVFGTIRTAMTGMAASSRRLLRPIRRGRQMTPTSQIGDRSSQAPL